jgi:hypothetical protein
MVITSANALRKHDRGANGLRMDQFRAGGLEVKRRLQAFSQMTGRFSLGS